MAQSLNKAFIQAYRKAQDSVTAETPDAASIDVADKPMDPVADTDSPLAAPAEDGNSACNGQFSNSYQATSRTHHCPGKYCRF